MGLILPKTCAMGNSNTGLVGTIGVTLLNPDGTAYSERTTMGIYELGGGCYGKEIAFDDSWNGVLKWDTGGGSPSYAVEEYNIEGLVAFIKEIEGGKWKILNNQMIFYKADNVTEIARFNLFDKAGVATEVNVMERVRV